MISPSYLIFIFLAVLLGVKADFDPFACVDCMMMYMPSCPNPGQCGKGFLPCKHCNLTEPSSECPNPKDCELAGCLNCMDYMPMNGCPNPGACGFKPPKCEGCREDMTPTDGCPKPQWCKTAGCWDCMDGMSMPGCPVPSVCGYEPLQCYGCVPGQPVGDKVNSKCPNPLWCGNVTTYPCQDCMDGMPMKNCPKPDFCGFKPIPCEGCMKGMSMPGCPHPEWCEDEDGGSSSSMDCMMNMVFGFDKHVCILFSSWNISNAGQWFGSCLAIVVACFVREFSSIYRNYRLAKRKQQRALSAKRLRQQQQQQQQTNGLNNPLLSSETAQKETPFTDYLIESLLYGFSLLLAYALMLIIMTYNVVLFLVVVVGSAFANLMCSYCFSRYTKKQQQQLQQQYGVDGSVNVDVDIKPAEEGCCEGNDYYVE